MCSNELVWAINEEIPLARIQNGEKPVISFCIVLACTGRKALLAKSHNSPFYRHCYRETWGNSHFDLAGEGRVVQVSFCFDLFGFDCGFEFCACAEKITLVFSSLEAKKLGGNSQNHRQRLRSQKLDLGTFVPGSQVEYLESGESKPAL